MAAMARPSLLLKMDIDSRQYSDELVAEIKRSYSYVAPSSVSACDIADTDSEDAQIKPLCNTFRLMVRMHRPYWDSNDAEAQATWEAVMPKWLNNMFRKVSNTITASNNVRRDMGQETLDYTWVEVAFDNNALIAIKTKGDSSIPADAPDFVEHIRRLMAKNAFGDNAIACVRVPSQESYDAHVTAAQATGEDDGPSQATDNDTDIAENTPKTEEDASDEEVGEPVSGTVTEETTEKPATASTTGEPEAEGTTDESAAEGTTKSYPSMPCIDVDYGIWGIEFADGSIREFDSATETFAD